MLPGGMAGKDIHASTAASAGLDRPSPMTPITWLKHVAWQGAMIMGLTPTEQATVHVQRPSAVPQPQPAPSARAPALAGYQH
jgi:hypothetical protein